MSSSSVVGSKRAATPQAGPSQPVKRARPTPTKVEDRTSLGQELDDDEDEPIPEGELDDAMQARVARKNARIIRNRESAQRSRNQRKAHVAWLEDRVKELEEENRLLRGGGSGGSSETLGVTPTSYSSRSVSPAHSVYSFATELGIPPEVVTGSGGVNLASIAPPPSGTVLEDVKPVLPTTHLAPVAQRDTLVSDSQAEISSLRERLSRLESLFKHVAAFGPITSPVVPAPSPLEIAAAPLQAPTPANWDELLRLTTPAGAQQPALQQTLSPPRGSRSISDMNTLPGFTLPSALSSDSDINPLARHPAVVATLPPSLDGKALQRARTPLKFDLALAQNQEWLTKVARLLVAWITLRISTSPHSFPAKGRELREKWMQVAMKQARVKVAASRTVGRLR